MMPKLRNKTRSAALQFAQRYAEQMKSGVNVYAAPKEGSKVWYIRPLDYPAPPCCECVAQVLLGPEAVAMEE
jgi:hypothetical protein